MDQAIAGITNQIIGGIVKGIAPFLGGLSGLLPGGGLDIGGFLRGKAENLQAIASMFECQDSPKLDGITKEGSEVYSRVQNPSKMGARLNCPNNCKLVSFPQIK